VDPLRELSDPFALRVRALRWNISDEIIAPRALKEALVDMVAVAHFCEELTESRLAGARRALRMSWEQSEEERARLSGSDRECVERLYYLYQAFPLSPAPFSMWRAPDAEAFLVLQQSPGLLEPPLGQEYPEPTRELLSLARERISTWGRIGARGDQDQPAAEPERFSPFFEAVFQREQAPAHIERRARAVLRDLLEGMRREANELRGAERRNFNPVRLFETLHRYLTVDAGVSEAVQPSVVAGLATGYFDCDVHTFVVIELGKQLGLPIDALYVLDPTGEQQIGHCLPVAVLREVQGVRYVPFEMRKPIHRTPEGLEKRVYDNFSQMIERINRLAGQQLLGPGAIVCRLTDSAKVELLQPYGEQREVSIPSSQIRVLYRASPSAVLEEK
jgi:hypothetical protein